MEESINNIIDLSDYNDIQERFNKLDEKVTKCNKIIENNLKGGAKKNLTTKEKDKKLDKYKKKTKMVIGKYQRLSYMKLAL